MDPIERLLQILGDDPERLVQILGPERAQTFMQFVRDAESRDTPVVPMPRDTREPNRDPLAIPYLQQRAQLRENAPQAEAAYLSRNGMAPAASPEEAVSIGTGLREFARRLGLGDAAASRLTASQNPLAQTLGAVSSMVAPAAEAALNFMAPQNPLEVVDGPVAAAAPIARRAAQMAPEEMAAFLARHGFTPEATQLTQVSNTTPTYRAALGLLDEAGASGRGLDYGAGRGLGSAEIGFDSFEPFPRFGFQPTYENPMGIPSDEYGRLTSLNVLNVLPPEARAEAVQNMGRILRPGGMGIVTTRGRDVLGARTGVPGPEPMSVLTGRGTYQKGFTPDELQGYMSGLLGDGYTVERAQVGNAPAGVMVARRGNVVVPSAGIPEAAAAAPAETLLADPRAAARAASRAQASAERRMLRDARDPNTPASDYLPRPTVDSPDRVAFPDVYLRPDRLIARANIADEDPLLKRLFGVTRDDLYQMSEGGTRRGTMEGRPFKTAANPRGSAAAKRVTTPENAQRILDTVYEAQKNEGLWRGMIPWYVMDPAYQRTVELVGEEAAPRVYNQFNALTGMASPASDVVSELARGTAANWLANEGRFDDFVRYAGIAQDKRPRNFPADMQEIPGHMAHLTAHAVPMQKYLRAGAVDMASPKVPSYIPASGVPAQGVPWQTHSPVGDAHFSRFVGLPDVRGLKWNRDKGLYLPNGTSASTPEMVDIVPWWQAIADEVGIQPVPLQAVTWGAGAPATGVTTAIGKPKLEILAGLMGKTGQRLGVSPEEARDLVLLGKTHAGFADLSVPAMLAGGGALGAGLAAALHRIRSRREENAPR